MNDKQNISQTQSTKVPLGGFRGLMKLAIRNLLGNGLKTWLSVFVLSISFVLIIFTLGMLEGWNRQALNDTIKWEIADGQYWSAKYDPYDPFSLDSASVPIPSGLKVQVESSHLEPILIDDIKVSPGFMSKGG